MNAMTLRASWCVLLALTASLAAADEPKERRSITVTGTGEVRVVPDRVQLEVGVESFAKTIDAALKENDESVARSLEVAKPFIADAKDVQTSQLAIYPQYDQSSQSSGRGVDYTKPIGFTVSRSISIRLDDVAKFTPLVRALIAAGTNRITSTSFQVRNPQPHRANAREMALLAAREKAVVMATVLQCRTGKPLKISEGSESGGPILWNRMNVSMQAGFAGDAGGDPVAAGSINISATVTVEFELE